MNLNFDGKPSSPVNRVISIILILVLGIAIVGVLVNRGVGRSKDILANGTPVNLYTHYSNIINNKYEITTWEGQPTFEEFISSSDNIVEVEYVSEEIAEVYGTEQRYFNMRVLSIIRDNGIIKQDDIIKVQGDMQEDENFSYKQVNSTILSLDKLSDGSYFPRNDIMGVFYVIDEKVYPACDVHDFAEYVGMQHKKFLKKINKIIK